METFWRTISLYNSSTWGWQLIIILAGIAMTILTIKKPGKATTIGMKVYFIALYLWIAIEYYYISCSERSYNMVMSAFWIVLALSWLWDLATGHTIFGKNEKYTSIATILMLMPFIYPIASLLRGLHYPEITSPVMPCSVVVFTIGALLMFSKKVNLFIVLLLCHWALIGFSKTYFFDIPEDYMLASATVPAVYLFLKEYYLRNIKGKGRYKAKYMDCLLITVCVVVCAILMYSMFAELALDK